MFSKFFNEHQSVHVLKIIRLAEEVLIFLPKFIPVFRCLACIGRKKSSCKTFLKYILFYLILRLYVASVIHAYSYQNWIYFVFLIVWQKLEQENQEFFNAYNLRLTLKEQIAEFNQLLDRQVKMMHHANTPGASYRPVSTSHVSPSKTSFNMISMWTL